jgi:hypothetical protein
VPPEAIVVAVSAAEPGENSHQQGAASLRLLQDRSGFGSRRAPNFFGKTNEHKL